MANPFDQFDQQQPPTANPFDQFDTPSIGQRALSAAGDVGDFLKRSAQWQGNRALNAATSAMEFGPLTPVRAAVAKASELGLPIPEWLQTAISPGAKVNQTVRDVTGLPQVNTPGGSIGKIIDAGVEGMLAGGPIAGARSFGAFLPNFVGGATANAAGQLTEGSPWQPVAQGVAGLLGAGAASLPSLARPTAGALVADSTKGMTPQQWQAGRTMQANANARGIPLMAHEALTGDSASPLGQLFGHVGASSAGGKIRSAAVDRIPGVKAAITSEADAIAPAIADPKAVDIALAKAADSAVKGPLGDRSKAATKFFDAAKTEPIDPQLKIDTLAAIKGALDEALPNGPVAAQLNKLKAQMEAAKTVGHADEIRENFKAIAQAQAFDGEPISDKVRVALKPIVKDMRAGLAATNTKYGAGLEKYDPANPLTQEVNAAQASGAGQIASAYQGKPDAAMGLFGKWIMDPDNARPATVKADLARLNKQDPNAAKSALRLYVENAADAAFQPTRGQPAIYGGSNFSKAVGGRPMARENMIAAVEGVTGNKTTAVGFANLLQILDRTGVTPGLGSPTATRTAANAQAANSGMLGAALDTANIMRGSALGPTREWVRDVRFRKVYGQLADLTTGPEGVRKLHELALLRPDSAKAQALANSIVQGVLGLEGATP